MIARIAYMKQEAVARMWEASRADLADLAVFRRVREPPTSVSNDETGCGAYMWVDEECLVIAFRGTISARDVIANLDMELVPVEVGAIGAAVQRGYLYRHESLIDGIRAEVDRLERAHVITSIHCIGHSLGGVDASLCALLLLHPERGGSLPITVHTVGCPNVGNVEFSMWSKPRLVENLRIVHILDVVSYLPVLRWGVGRRINLLNMTGSKDLFYHSCDMYVWWLCGRRDWEIFFQHLV